VVVIAAVLVLTTGLRVEYFGTIITFDTAVVGILLLLFAPTEPSKD